MVKCKYLVFRDGMMFCGKWKHGQSVEINEQTCERCPILGLEQGKHCEFLDFGIRSIEQFPEIGVLISSIVNVAMTCRKLGKSIRNISECDGCPDRASEFLSKQVLVEARAILQKCGFQGPLQEFNDAYERYVNGDPKGCITSASSAFESTMKSVLQKESVTLSGRDTASQLLRLLEKRGYFFPFLQHMSNAMVAIMQGLPTIRNKASIAHGQGPSVKETENSYAEFALHLTGTFNLFIIKRFLERNPNFKP